MFRTESTRGNITKDTDYFTYSIESKIRDLRVVSPFTLCERNRGSHY